ncbi:MAG TPA: carboxypeptidase regulatory-like domain-containing protein, partial [Candidatus Eisenbacteria bacterium]|nr:carboxypeptidase regulatory-like domain-containing protein [Candidatus Eisenbacteria bacterium]
APEPAAGAVAGKVAADRASGAVAQNEPAPGAPAPAPAGEAMARFAAPGHLQEMRRDSVTGEEVPVPSPRDQAFARPPVTSPTPTGRIAKPRYAEPAGAGAAAIATRRGEVCGVVKDNAGHPVAGATVTIAATRASTATDHTGSFCIPAAGASATLAIRASGFLPKTVTGKPGGRVMVELEAQPAQSTARAIAQTQGNLGAQSAEVAAAFENLPAYPRSVARNAERLTAVADRLQSAGGYDHAAGEWERLLPFVKGGPLETEVRWQAASTRMHAWQSGANDHRRQDAADAIVSYLAKAPVSDRRDQAQKWLDQVKR